MQKPPVFPYYGDKSIPVSVQIIEKKDFIPFYQPSNTIELHTHPYYEITYLSDGFAVHKFRDTEATLIAGDCFITRPGETHAWRQLTNFKGFVIQISEENIENKPYFNLLSELSSLIHSAVISDKNLPLTKENSDNPMKVKTPIDEYYQPKSTDTQGVIHIDSDILIELNQLSREINIENSNKLLNHIPMVENLLYNALILLSRAKERNFIVEEDRKNSSPSKSRKLVDHMIKHFHTHIADKTDFNELSRELGYSEVYLRTLFKNTTGLSPTKYMNRARVSAAMDLLLRADLSIEDVGAKVGVLDGNYFIRMFKANTGVTPNTFRKQNTSSTASH